MLVAKKEEASKALVAFTGNNFQFEKINKAIEKLGTVDNLTKEEKKEHIKKVTKSDIITFAKKLKLNVVYALCEDQNGKN